MPKPTTPSNSPVLTVMPNPCTGGVSTTFTVVGANFPRKVNTVVVGVYGEMDAFGNGALGTAGVVGGNFTLPFTRSFMGPAEGATWEYAEVIIEVREKHTGDTGMGATPPPVLAKTTLLVD